MTTTTTNDIVTPGTSLVAYVPDYDLTTGGAQRSLLRLGAYDSTDESLILSGIPSQLLVNGAPPPGWLEYTDGDRTQTTIGTVRESIGGDYYQYIGGRGEINVDGEYRFNIAKGTLKVYNADPIYKIEFFEQEHVYAGGKTTWRKREMGHVSADTYSFGDTENFFAGYKFDATFGMTNGIFIGGKIDFSLALSVGLNFGYAVNLGANVTYSNVKGAEIKVAGDHDIKGRKTIDLRIKPELLDPAPSLTRDQILAIAAVVSGTVVAAGIAAGSAGGEVSSDGTSATPAGCLAGATAAFTIGMIVSLVLALKEKASNKLALSRVLMDRNGVTIARNDPAGRLPVAAVNVDANGVRIAHNSPTGMIPQSEIAVEDQGHIKISTVHNSFVELRSNQNIVVQAARDALFQTGTYASKLALLSTGAVRMKSTQANFEGNLLTFGLNQDLRIG